MEIISKSIEEGWKKALKYIIENGKDFIDGDGRTCREVINLSICVEDKEDVIKPIEIINSFEKWIYPPLEELESVVLSKKEIAGYYYNYGARAFNFNDINQIDSYLIPLLKKDKTTRRATVVFYNPMKDSFLFKKDVPGMIMVNFNIRNNKLNVLSVIRSNDLFFGWPANVYQVYILQKYVAEKVGYEMGELQTFSISAHIFEDQFDDINRVLHLDS